MSRTRLILMPSSPDEAAPYVTLDASGIVLDRGRASPDQPLVGPAVRTVAVTPGARVTLRRLTLPVGTDAQRRAAALWALKDDLAAPAERLRAAVGRAEADGGAWVAIVDEAVATGWSAWLAASGAPNAVLVPDALALEPGADGAVTTVRFGQDLALRTVDFAATVQPELIDVVAAGRTLNPVEDPADVEAMLLRAALNPPLDLAATVRAAAGGWKAWRRAGVLAAALILSPLVLVTAEAMRDDAAARQADRRAEAAARRLFPDLATAPDPLTQAEARLVVLPPPGGVAATSAALFLAVEAVPQAELDAVTVDAQGGFRASLTYPAFQDLDAIRQALEAQGLTLVEVSTVEDAGRVASDVIIGAAE